MFSATKREYGPQRHPVGQSLGLIRRIVAICIIIFVLLLLLY